MRNVQLQTSGRNKKIFKEIFGLKLKLRDPVELDNIQDSSVWGFLSDSPHPQPPHCIAPVQKVQQEL